MKPNRILKALILPFSGKLSCEFDANLVYILSSSTARDTTETHYYKNSKILLWFETCPTEDSTQELIAKFLPKKSKKRACSGVAFL